MSSLSMSQILLKSFMDKIVWLELKISLSFVQDDRSQTSLVQDRHVSKSLPRASGQRYPSPGTYLGGVALLTLGRICQSIS